MQGNISTESFDRTSSNLPSHYSGWLFIYEAAVAQNKIYLNPVIVCPKIKYETR